MPILFYGLANLAATGGTAASTFPSGLKCSQVPTKRKKVDLLISIQRHVCRILRGYVEFYSDQHSHMQRQSLVCAAYSSLLSTPSAAAAASLHTAEGPTNSCVFLHRFNSAIGGVLVECE